MTVLLLLFSRILGHPFSGKRTSSTRSLPVC